MQAGTLFYLNDNVNAKACLIKAEPRERSLIPMWLLGEGKKAVTKLKVLE